MIYAQFWHRGTHGLLIPACGSDSVLPIDGRFGTARQHAVARERLSHPFFAAKFEAYSIHAGPSFSRSRPLQSLPATARGMVRPDDVSPEYLDSRARLAA